MCVCGGYFGLAGSRVSARSHKVDGRRIVRGTESCRAAFESKAEPRNHFWSEKKKKKKRTGLSHGQGQEA